MLTDYERNRIKDLAHKKFSLRAIAQRTGHSRGTIARVLSQPPKPPRQTHPRTKSRRRARSIQVHFSVDYSRCPGCGLLVKLPCLACQIERLKMVDRFLKAA